MSNLSGEPWSDADLFFLSNTLRHGMSVEEVAGFLSRTAAEVRTKAEELHVPLSNLGGARQRQSRH
jgi:hypothetical protein